MDKNMMESMKNIARVLNEQNNEKLANYVIENYLAGLRETNLFLYFKARAYLYDNDYSLFANGIKGVPKEEIDLLKDILDALKKYVKNN